MMIPERERVAFSGEDDESSSHGRLPESHCVAKSTQAVACNRR